MNIVKTHRNVHELLVESDNFKIAMLSDLHWDNPKCDRELLKSHLDYCLKENIPVMINGDFFCLMQGRGDNRRNKNDIRPEHNNARYLDSIVTTAVEWFEPYANIITVIGYGNHETAIIKFQETDLLARFVDLLNYKCGSNVQTGGYGGWLNIKMNWREKLIRRVIIKYFHGSGGGGIVTKGNINLTRALQMYEGMDVFSMGHIHENSARNDVRETLKFGTTTGTELHHHPVHMILTGTYKEEYTDGFGGWHVERGAPIKPLGGRILTIQINRKFIKNCDTTVKKIDSNQFPI